MFQYYAQGSNGDLDSGLGIVRKELCYFYIDQEKQFKKSTLLSEINATIEECHFELFQSTRLLILTTNADLGLLKN